MEIIILILFLHWLADFVLQTDKQAKNKSKNLISLLSHTLIYSICFIYFGVYFVLITFATHSLIDYITSKINSKLYSQNKTHWFFVSIGFDQFLHITQLLITYKFLTN